VLLCKLQVSGNLGEMRRRGHTYPALHQKEVAMRSQRTLATRDLALAWYGATRGQLHPKFRQLSRALVTLVHV
jgi:hypothetical protein